MTQMVRATRLVLNRPAVSAGDACKRSSTIRARTTTRRKLPRRDETDRVLCLKIVPRSMMTKVMVTFLEQEVKVPSSRCACPKPYVTFWTVNALTPCQKRWANTLETAWAKNRWSHG